MKVRFSKGLRVPLLVLDGREYWPWKWSVVFRRWLAFRKIPKGLHFSDESRSAFYIDGREWAKNYLPPDSVSKDALIVDVGARDGDSALFYLSHGYTNLRLVEADAKYWPGLHHNEEIFRSIFHPRIELVLAPFTLDCLDGAAFVKFDCEGCQGDILDSLEIPWVAEMHVPNRPDKDGVFPYVKATGYRRSP